MIERRRLNEGRRRRGKGLRVLGRRVRRGNFEADLVSSSRFWDILRTKAFEIPPAFQLVENFKDSWRFNLEKVFEFLNTFVEVGKDEKDGR